MNYYTCKKFSDDLRKIKDSSTRFENFLEEHKKGFVKMRISDLYKVINLSNLKRITFKLYGVVSDDLQETVVVTNLRELKKVIKMIDKKYFITSMSAIDFGDYEIEMVRRYV